MRPSAFHGTMIPAFVGFLGYWPAVQACYYSAMSLEPPQDFNYRYCTNGVSL